MMVGKRRFHFPCSNCVHTANASRILLREGHGAALKRCQSSSPILRSTGDAFQSGTHRHGFASVTETVSLEASLKCKPGVIVSNVMLLRPCPAALNRFPYALAIPSGSCSAFDSGHRQHSFPSLARNKTEQRPVLSAYRNANHIFPYLSHRKPNPAAITAPRRQQWGSHGRHPPIRTPDPARHPWNTTLQPATTAVTLSCVAAQSLKIRVSAESNSYLSF